MLNDNFGKVRLFLLEQGFFQDPTINMESGTVYKYIIPDSRDTYFTIDMKNKIAEAHYPDFKFNKNNPYSTKSTVVDFEFKDIPEPDCVIENLSEFFSRIMSIVEKG